MMPRDLLCSGTAGFDLLHIHNSRDGVIVQNLSSMEVYSPKNVGDLIQSASCIFATVSTAMNTVSSRSHDMCTLNVTIAPLGDGSANKEVAEEVTTKITLVDLAGLERIKRTGAIGAQMKEDININK
eukprot:3645083-Ditylum_brightwellii.AAC.1